MANKSFVTLFDRTKNFHLVKDVGQIAFHMYKEFDYNSKIVTCKNEDNYMYLDKEVKGLKIQFIPNIKFFKINLGVIFYLVKNAKNIDILHQFHIRNYTLFYAFLYKLLNKNGINYIKADANEKSLIHQKNIIKKKYLKIIDKYIDHLSFETKEIAELIKRKYSFSDKKVFQITNGIDRNYVNTLNLENTSCLNKENIILYVARIGTHQKNTELFLNAIEKINLDCWEVHLIGDIEDDFKPFIKDFFIRNSELKSKVIFHGNITSRKEIYKYYLRSKIFCMTSRYEGFPLVYPEAIYFGNYIVTTDVSGANDITNNGEFGDIIKNSTSDEYAKRLTQSLSLEKLNNGFCEEIRFFAMKNFTWQSIVLKLNQKFTEL